MEDNRKTVKLNPDVGDRFDERKPEGLSQSEFVSELLNDAEFKEGVTADEVRDIVRHELERFEERLMSELR